MVGIGLVPGRTGEGVAHGRFPNGVESRFVARYHEFASNERIVYDYDMHAGGVFLSVSLATLEFEARDSGTAFRITEQGVFIDGNDGNPSRRERREYLLGKMAETLSD